MVEQRAVTVRRFLQFVQVVRNHTHVVLVDRGELSDPLLILAMVRSSMETAGNAAFRERTSRSIAAQFKRRNSSDVADESQHLKVEHEFDMLFPGSWNSNGRGGQLLASAGSIAFL